MQIKRVAMLCFSEPSNVVAIQCREVNYILWGRKPIDRCTKSIHPNARNEKERLECDVCNSVGVIMLELPEISLNIPVEKRWF